nr:hypothetical protein [Mangrovicella endophytica]
MDAAHRDRDGGDVCGKTAEIGQKTGKGRGIGIADDAGDLERHRGARERLEGCHHSATDILRAPAHRIHRRRVAIKRKVEAYIAEAEQPVDDRRRQFGAVAENLHMAVAVGESLDQFGGVGEHEQLAAADLHHRCVDMAAHGIDHRQHAADVDRRAATLVRGGGGRSIVAGVSDAGAVAALQVAEITGNDEIVIEKALHGGPPSGAACLGDLVIATLD